MRFTKSTAVLAASLSVAIAQTFTSCNPLEKTTCPKDLGLPLGAFSSDFTQGKSASWSTAAYSTMSYGSSGAEFSISGPKQAPTMETDFYIFFGRISVKAKAAPGAGIVSSIVLESDDLDEIDWEFIGGDTSHVQTNFYGKGNTTTYDRVIYEQVDSPQTTFHTYTLDWNAQRLEYIIDGTTVRTLPYNDPLALGGKNYPQTPMKLKLGNWCGGCAGEPKGTIQWAGGPTTFGNDPYVMYVESVDITNYNPADSYEYTDTSGSWQSIKIIKDGKSSQPNGSGSGSPSTYPTGNQTAVVPTKSHHVGGVKNTDAAVSSTVTGKSYSMNTSSISAQNSGHNGGGVKTSTIMATTEVPGSQPTDAGPGSVPGAGSGPGGASASASASAPATNGAVSNGVFMSTSLVGLLFGFLLL
jgi:beta-glucanase (GH16 family)